jgi:hypothetical protein
MHKLWGIIKIIVFFIILISIPIYLYVEHYRSSISKNWSKHRLNPMFLPIAGIFKKDFSIFKKDFTATFFQDTLENFITWFWNISKHYFDILMKPIFYVVDLIARLIQEFQKTLNLFKSQVKKIRNLFSDIVLTVAEKMTKTQSAINFYQSKLFDLYKRQRALFEILLFFGQAFALTATSFLFSGMQVIEFLLTMLIVILIGVVFCFICQTSSIIAMVFDFLLPIPNLLCMFCLGEDENWLKFIKKILKKIWPICIFFTGNPFCCFDSETPITLANHSQKYIKDIEIGDNILLGGKVTSLLKVKTSLDDEIYNYQNIIVSGTHLVYYQGKPIFIKDCPEAQLITHHRPSYLYCLITENHKLIINNITFCDYHESRDRQTDIKNMILFTDNLNNTKTHILPNLDTCQWGFSSKTLVKINNSKYVPICKIKIGDMLYNDNLVIGVVKHCGIDVSLYNYQGNIISGSQLLFINGKWIRPCQHYQKDYHKIDYLYNIITSHHNFYLTNNILVKDYLDFNNETIKIQEINNINSIINND